MRFTPFGVELISLCNTTNDMVLCQEKVQVKLGKVFPYNPYS